MTVRELRTIDFPKDGHFIFMDIFLLFFKLCRLFRWDFLKIPTHSEFSPNLCVFRVMFQCFTLLNLSFLIEFDFFTISLFFFCFFYFLLCRFLGLCSWFSFGSVFWFDSLVVFFQFSVICFDAFLIHTFCFSGGPFPGCFYFQFCFLDLLLLFLLLPWEGSLRSPTPGAGVYLLKFVIGLTSPTRYRGQTHVKSAQWHATFWAVWNHSHSRHCGTARSSNCRNALKPHPPNSCVEAGLLHSGWTSIPKGGLAERNVLGMVIAVGILETGMCDLQPNPKGAACSHFVCPITLKLPFPYLELPVRLCMLLADDA
jgi:hypothetical protein